MFDFVVLAERGSLDWLTKLHEPFFKSSQEAERYVSHELEVAVPKDWRIVRQDRKPLSWVLEKAELSSGEWPNQDYCVWVTTDLAFVIITHGNNDVGPLSLHQVLQNALVIESVMMREFSLAECVHFLFATKKPNEWGYT